LLATSCLPFRHRWLFRAIDVWDCLDCIWYSGWCQDDVRRCACRACFLDAFAQRIARRGPPVPARVLTMTDASRSSVPHMRHNTDLAGLRPTGGFAVCGSAELADASAERLARPARSTHICLRAAVCTSAAACPGQCKWRAQSVHAVS